jgi:hypothetical protein
LERKPAYSLPTQSYKKNIHFYVVEKLKISKRKIFENIGHPRQTKFKKNSKWYSSPVPLTLVNFMVI